MLTGLGHPEQFLKARMRNFPQGEEACAKAQSQERGWVAGEEGVSIKIQEI